MNMTTRVQALKLGAITLLISTVLPTLLQVISAATPVAANLA